jgi:predicted unusual protein kinase regulating ubiquinone biosynthesis (AarF/ABC1/UbiB family)
LAGQNTFVRTFTIARKLMVPLFYYARAQRKFLATNSESKPSPAEVRHAADLLKRIVELGPTFIKFGQILATRSDVLPQSYLDALSTLHDEVPPAPFDLVKKEVEKELGPIGKTFASIEETPIASASLGQVHRARLLNGQEIVLKVRRPGVEGLIETDLKVLKRLAPFLRLVMESFQAYLFETIIVTFSQTIFDEMDYRKEAMNQERIASNIAKSDIDRVVVPRVLPQYTTELVLAEEYVPGIKITDVSAIEAAGIDRKELASRLNSLYLEMVINHDIFHADPHPGNIAVEPDGTLVLYDFGMVGRLEDAEKRTIISLYYAMMLRDTDRTIAKMTELGLVNPDTEPSLVKAGIALSFRTWEGKGLDRTGLNELIRIANKTLHSYPVHLTPTVAELMKTSQMQDGLTTTLDPQFNLLDNLLKFEEKSGHLDQEISEDVDQMVDQFWESLTVLPKLTKTMYDFFSDDTRLMDDVMDPPTGLRVALALVFVAGGALAAWYGLRTGQPVLAVISGAAGTCFATVAVATGRRTRRVRRSTR